ncbi:6542_t:CDS:2, partial [Ambispora gerdemannii]
TTQHTIGKSEINLDIKKHVDIKIIFYSLQKKGVYATQSHDTSFRRTWTNMNTNSVHARTRARREQQLEEEEEQKTTQLAQSTSMPRNNQDIILKIVRIRHKEGMSRFGVDPNDDIMALAEKVRIFALSHESITAKWCTSEIAFRTEHRSVGNKFPLGPFEPTTNTSSSLALNVKQEAVDDYLEKQSGGFIKRGCDPKLYA